MFRYFTNIGYLVSVKTPVKYYSTYKSVLWPKTSVISRQKCGLSKPNFNSNFRHFTTFTNHDRHPLLNLNKYGNKRIFCLSQQFQKNSKESTDKHHAKELEIVSLRFPSPKSILHNFYNAVATELKSPNYNIKPQFKMNHVMHPPVNALNWTCSYNIKWPRDMKFQAMAPTKSDASTKAAYKALLYLQNSGKITDNGLPVIYDKRETRQVIKDSMFRLVLDESVERGLNSVIDVFEEKLLPCIRRDEFQPENELGDETQTEVPLENDILTNWGDNKRKISQRFLEKYRAKELQKLPIQKHRAEFEGLLENNQVVIVRGEPGCGKSTRIPQYILEQWVKNTGQPARIVVTQPRRIAAISLAEHVAQERNEAVGSVVGYQVRLKSCFNTKTGQILYCTTGILLRQIQADANLHRCTHVILDEAHERDVNTDLLMNLLRHALALNPNLKLIIMSATIDVGLFQNYFHNVPVMQVPGFTHPINTHFLENIKLPLDRIRRSWNHEGKIVVAEEVAQVIKWIDKRRPPGAILCFLPGWEEIIKVKQLLMHMLHPGLSIIVAIHSKLSPEDQKKIFRRPPEGVRKVVLATNIAETSVTVDDVVYVVDTGVQKESRFDPQKGVSCVDNHQISQASMRQRRGRAGRVQPGESFHLYPKSTFEKMAQFSDPEILKVSLTKIVLDAKVYSHNMSSIDFFADLVSPPQNSTVLKAVEELQDLEMLDSNEDLTPLGRVVSDFQLPPKLSKAMIHSVIYKCVIPIVDIATIFNSDSNMFSNVLTNKENIKQIKQKFCKDSDHIALMILFEQWANMMNNNDLHDAAVYCSKYNLLPHKLNTLKQLKDIHYEYLAKYLRDALELSDDFSANKEFIKGVLLHGVGTVLFQRKWDFVKGSFKNKSVLITKDKQKATITSESVNHKCENYEFPFLLYINETRSETRRTTIIRETSVIQPLTFILFKNSELHIDDVLDRSLDIPDPVRIYFEGTEFKMLCSKKQANILYKCKIAMKQMEDYFIYQLTKGGREDPEVQENWNKILHILNEVLRPNTSNQVL